PQKPQRTRRITKNTNALVPRLRVLCGSWCSLWIRLPAGEVGGAGAVVDGLAEEAAIEEGAAEPEVEVELPGEADAAVQLGGVAGDAVVEVAHVRLHHGGVARGMILDAVESVRRVPDQRE